MKRLGPELKMPDLESLKGLNVPPFLADVYYDLRDRRLLPLVALVVVAIAAVPFLLGDDGEEAVLPPVPAEEAGTAGAGAAEGAGRLTVVAARPGLRDYRKRLRRRTPTDPFKQRYTSLPEGAQLRSTTVSSGGGGGGGGSSEASVTDVEVTEQPDSPPDAGGSPGSGGSAGSGGSPGRETSPGSDRIDPRNPGLRFYAFRPDVRFGVAGSGELREHEDIATGRVLPKRNPVVVFVGVTEDGKRAVFDVSPEVAMVRGPGRCIGGNQSCSLLFLREGQAADLLTGKPDRTFRLKVRAIEFVEVKRPKGARSSAARQAWGTDLAQSFSK